MIQNRKIPKPLNPFQEEYFTGKPRSDGFLLSAEDWEKMKLKSIETIEQSRSEEHQANS